MEQHDTAAAWDPPSSELTRAAAATHVQVRRMAQARPLEDLGKRFIGWLPLRRSPNTVKAYAVALNDFCQFARDQGIAELTDIDHRAVEAFLAWLLAKGKSPRSINLKLAALRSWWKWMRIQGVTTSTAPDDCEQLKVGHRLPSYLSIAETRTLLKGLAKRRGLCARRDEAIIATACLTGLRCAELVALRVEDLDLAAGVMRVIGKGDKQREAAPCRTGGTSGARLAPADATAPARQG